MNLLHESKNYLFHREGTFALKLHIHTDDLVQALGAEARERELRGEQIVFSNLHLEKADQTVVESEPREPHIVAQRVHALLLQDELRCSFLHADQ